MSFTVTAQDYRTGAYASMGVSEAYDNWTEKAFNIALNSFHGCPVGTPFEGYVVASEPSVVLFATNYGSIPLTLGEQKTLTYRRWSTGEESYGCMLQVVATVVRPDGTQTSMQLAVEEFRLYVNPAGGLVPEEEPPHPPLEPTPYTPPADTDIETVEPPPVVIDDPYPIAPSPPVYEAPPTADEVQASTSKLLTVVGAAIVAVVGFGAFFGKKRKAKQRR